MEDDEVTANTAGDDSRGGREREVWVREAIWEDMGEFRAVGGRGGRAFGWWEG